MIHFEGLPTSSEGFLGTTGFLDFEHPGVADFVHSALDGATDPRRQAIRLFYAVRDQIRYDPYNVTFDPLDYKASNVIAAGHGWCVSKAVLLAACARSVGIASAIGLADVVNHLNTEKLRRKMGGVDIFYDHGYAALLVEGRWVKAAPAFNIELCDRFAVRPTEFDGRDDALYQAYDRNNRLHMEYLADHGTWSDLPLQKLRDDFVRYYPAGLVADRRAADDGERFEDGQRV